jgi:uncharacterized membrane protein YvbJ
MFCKNCGAAIDSNALFCQSCGTKKDETASNSTSLQPRTTGNSYSTVSMIMGAIAIWIFPIIFGPIALILGAVAKSKNESKATTAIVIAALGTVFGMIFGALAWSGY